MRNVFRIIFVLIIVGVFFGTMFSNPSVRAQEEGALQLTTSPLPISLVAKPGETVETDIRVRNSGLQAETLKVGLMKFSAQGNEGKPQLAEREASDTFLDWASFSEDTFLAEPNEWQTIKMTIKLPANAAFGYYYAVTFSRANPSVSNAPRQTEVQGGTAVLVLLEAKVPNARRSMELVSFTADKKTYEFLPVKFTAELRNTGNVHSIPSGSIFITKGDKEVGSIPVNVTRGNVLPESTRAFTAEWGDGFPVYELKEQNDAVVLKDGRQVYQLKWDASKLTHLRFGKYNARLVMVYDDGTKDVPIEAIVSFWVIPWRIIVPVVLVALFVGVGLFATVMKFYRKVRKKKL